MDVRHPLGQAQDGGPQVPTTSTLSSQQEVQSVAQALDSGSAGTQVAMVTP